MKKSEIYRSLWESCDQLRGKMDASEYKNYILTLLFVKQISDKYAGKANALIEIPLGGGFADLVALKGDKEIGDKINKAIGRLAEANEKLRGVITLTDFNEENKLGKGKDMQDTLAKLVAIFEGLDFHKNRAEGDDLLGDAYEYLMRHFATQSGKSKGEFYTPAEVSRIIAQVIGINENTPQTKSIYDPTCGSGSLLLKAADETPRGLTIYGQEQDSTTTALAKMNMFLHNNATALIENDNTLTNPKFKDEEDNTKLKRFDFVVANPPFSKRDWQNGFAKNKKTITDPYERFHYGFPPPGKGDYAFLLHIIHSLKSTGKAAVVLPHGVLFRGNAEAGIRKNIVKAGYIKGVIGLPTNLFYGTGIPACIIVLDKETAKFRQGILMINASKGFIKDGNKNRLRSQDIHKIVDVFKQNLELPGFSRMVPRAEIADPKNDYNLNLPRYIDSLEESDNHDLTAHLQGGIPSKDVDALAPYWEVFPTTRKVLFSANEKLGYLNLQVPVEEIKKTILQSPECRQYASKVKNTLANWMKKNETYLKALDKGCRPKEVIHKIAEDILQAFEKLPLIDKYDIYQYLMDYWSEVLQDDIYQIAEKGWEKAVEVTPLDKKKKNNKAKQDQDMLISLDKKGEFKVELIPPALIIQRYYPNEQKKITELSSQEEAVTQNIADLIDEHSGEEGLLVGVTDDNNKLTQKALKNRIKEIKQNQDFLAEMEVLQQALKLLKEKNALTQQIKTQKLALNQKTLLYYNDKLSPEEIKHLVVIDKWFFKLKTDSNSEVERITQNLANRIIELEKRYAHPLPEISKKVSKYSKRVEGHLKKMGLHW